ncbi:hypothetical protein PV08_07584 [Exophiala spinifera]|uniref:Uncharacterized protein n=1 Tax=Exophiala spinifera TaxID=91928 RepID=A0A0D2BU38_9EURO|nr:uncharacterized protein PV08_07584 [Exophiala spinifera]KIW14799.1 hypothetical protein PV08_07584 [Exophiala spinifera]
MPSERASFVPRERRRPMVPEPFPSISVSRQSVSFLLEPMARRWCKFCPILDIPLYRDQLNEAKQQELDKSASALSLRAIGNTLYKASEFCWEVDAWRFVFNSISDDKRLRIDKRPYEFIVKDEHDNVSVEQRIPDATMGLRSYDDFDITHGFNCHVTDCTEDHSGMQPDRTLLQDRLVAQMINHEGGLIVDGVWGKTDILFPFAVYEAKKGATIEQARDQIYHACRVYLAMLDDLARNPANVSEYQSRESKKYQLFAFLSCGAYWEVFVAWHFLNECFVETIWTGNIKEFSRAYDLICIVNQIHAYAISEHRSFVIKHLEPWLSRAESFRGAQMDLSPLPSGEDSVESLESSPKWFVIKGASRRALSAKRAATRMRKRRREELETDASDEQTSRRQTP